MLSTHNQRVPGSRLASAIAPEQGTLTTKIIVSLDPGVVNGYLAGLRMLLALKDCMGAITLE